MMDAYERKLIVVWTILLGITLVSWEFIGATHAIHSGLPVVLVILLAFVKVRFVLLDFMEVRHAPLVLRLALELWAGVACVAIIGALLLKH